MFTSDNCGGSENRWGCNHNRVDFLIGTHFSCTLISTSPALSFSKKIRGPETNTPQPRIMVWRNIMPRLIDLTQQRFGRLVVIRRAEENQNGRTTWLCRCSCGNEVSVTRDHLISGGTQSCGCLRKRHGHNTRNKVSATYRIWGAMIHRCHNPNSSNYASYGRRGITVCDRWREFVNFLEDMGEVPPGYQIDRIDNSKGYYRDNCRWVTSKTNNRNRRNNRLITYHGKTQTLPAWCDELGIPYTRLWARLYKLGWSVEKAFTVS